MALMFRSICTFKYWIVLSLFITGQKSNAEEIQFDFFPGFREHIVEKTLSPAGFEVFSENQAIRGKVRITRNLNVEDATFAEFPLEIPAGTRKRFHVPISFQQNSRYIRADLYDEKNQILASREIYNLRIVRWPAGIFLSISSRPLKGFAIPDELDPRNRVELTVGNYTRETKYGAFVSLRPFEFPSQSELISGVKGIYLESESIALLSEAQLSALITWVENGGKLVISASQIAEITQSNKLESWLGIVDKNETGLLEGANLCRYISNTINRKLSFHRKHTPGSLNENLWLENAQIPYTGLVFAGKSEAELDGQESPLFYNLRRGLGKVVLLPYDLRNSGIPDWKGFPWFWVESFDTSHLVAVNYEVQDISQSNSQSSQRIDINSGSDNGFSQMVYSLQIKSIPVFLMLFILIVYLIVIGPIDWVVLKKLKRQMLTWITFPVTVILFSAVIYVVGFSIRAGKTEWKAVHIFKMPLPGHGDSVVGRTYAGIYSPANRNYNISSEVATGAVTSLSNQKKAIPNQLTESGKGFSTDLFVGVWSTAQFRLDYGFPAPQNQDVTFNVSKSDTSAPLLNISISPESTIEKFVIVKGARARVVDRAQENQLSIPLQFDGNRPGLTDVHKFSNGFDYNVNIENSAAYNNRRIRRAQRNENIGDPGKWHFDSNTPVFFLTQNVKNFFHQGQTRLGHLGNRFQSMSNNSADSLAVPWSELKDSVIVFGIDDDFKQSPINLGFNPRFRKELGIYRWVVPLNEPHLVATKN